MGSSGVSRILGRQGTDVASAADITLGSGNYFVVTGTTTVESIIGTGWASGSIVVLQFTANVLVAHNGEGAGVTLALAGAANFSATAGDTLTLIFDGPNNRWREIARAVI